MSDLKWIYFLRINVSLSKLTFSFLIALHRIYRTEKRDASYYLTRRCAFKLFESRGKCRRISVSLLMTLKRQNEKKREAREEEREYTEKVILSRIHCARALFIFLPASSTDLWFTCGFSPVWVSTLLYLIQPRLYSAGWLCDLPSVS